MEDQNPYLKTVNLEASDASDAILIDSDKLKVSQGLMTQMIIEQAGESIE